MNRCVISGHFLNSEGKPASFSGQPRELRPSPFVTSQPLSPRLFLGKNDQKLTGSKTQRRPIVHVGECWDTRHESLFPPGGDFFRNFAFAETLSVNDPDVPEIKWKHRWIEEELYYNILFSQTILLLRSKVIRSQSWLKIEKSISYLFPP